MKHIKNYENFLNENHEDFIKVKLGTKYGMGDDIEGDCDVIFSIESGKGGRGGEPYRIVTVGDRRSRPEILDLYMTYDYNVTTIDYELDELKDMEYGKGQAKKALNIIKNKMKEYLKNDVPDDI